MLLGFILFISFVVMDISNHAGPCLQPGKTQNHPIQTCNYIRDMVAKTCRAPNSHDLNG